MCKNYAVLPKLQVLHVCNTHHGFHQNSAISEVEIGLFKMIDKNFPVIIYYTFYIIHHTYLSWNTPHLKAGENSLEILKSLECCSACKMLFHISCIVLCPLLLCDAWSAIFQEDKKGRRRALAQANVNMKDFAKSQPTQGERMIELKPCSKKCTKAILTFTISCILLREGAAT